MRIGPLGKIFDLVTGHYLEDLDPQQNGERLRVSESPAKAAGNPSDEVVWD